MAKTVYVNGITGDNTWDGLSPTYVSGTNGPKKTILGARAATVASDLVLIAPGVYVESTIWWTSGNDNLVLYRRDPSKEGKVIIDFENSGAYQASGGGGRPPYYWGFADASRVSFMDIHFRNPANGVAFCGVVNNDGRNFIHCVFYQRDGTANTGIGITAYNAGGNVADVFNCTFYNLATGFYEFSGTHYGNYFNSVTTPIYSPQGVNDYNAYPGNAESNGINTTTGADPGLTDASGEDFTLDRTTTPADWTAFQVGGKDGLSIGAWGDGGYSFRPNITQLYPFSPAPTYAQGNPQDTWENEGPNGTNTYTDGTPGDLVLNAGGEIEIDLATTPAATGGRMRSPVFDLGAVTGLLRAASFAGWEDPGVGAMFDTNNTLPQQAEYRVSLTSFAKGDASPSWTAFTRGTDLNQTAKRYIQYRVTLRTDHTNA